VTNLGLADWIGAFRELHEKARRGGLLGSERMAYLAWREDLGRMMLAAQRLSLRPGMIPRRMVRVARALQLDLELEGQKLRAFTIDFSTGGFSTMRAPSIGTDLTAALRLPAEAPVRCRARVTDVRSTGEHHRVSARFLDLSPEDKERLELFVFDAVLAQLR
jgi:hypothetical protein